MRVSDLFNISEAGQASISRSSRAIYIERSGAFRFAEIDELRVSYELYNNDSQADNLTFFRGALIEPARKNLVKNTAQGSIAGTYATPALMSGSSSIGLISNGNYSVSFYGSGSVRVLCNDVDLTVLGSDSDGRTFDAFQIPTFATCTLEFQGLVYGVNLELAIGSVAVGAPAYRPWSEQSLLSSAKRADLFGYPTSWIPTSSSAVTRDADVILNEGVAALTFVNVDADYNSASTYAIENRVSYFDDIYQALDAVPIDTPPNRNAYPYGTEPDNFWIYVKSANEKAFADGATNAGSSGTGEQHVSIISSAFLDTVAMLGANASVAEACVQHFGAAGVSAMLGSNKESALLRSNKTVYERSQVPTCINSLSGSKGSVSSFRIVSALDDATNDPIDPSITVSISEFVAGASNYIGEGELGAGTSVLSKATERTNTFGTSNRIEKGFRKELTVDVMIDRSFQNTVFNKITDLFEVNTLWVVSEREDDSEVLIIFGAYNDYNTSVLYPENVRYSLKISSLII